MKVVSRVSLRTMFAVSVWGMATLAVPVRAQNAAMQMAQLPPLQEQVPQPGSPSGVRTPYQQAPIPQTPYQQSPYQQAPAPQTPYQQAPYQQAPAPQPPYQQPPYQQAPAPQPPQQEAPVPQAPHQQVPAPPNVSGSGAQGQSQTPPAAPPTTFERPNTWISATVAKLVALDKVNAQASELTIKVGQSATFESLTITVKACVVRPPDQPADAAVYLHVTDSHPDSPGFDGWMLENEPAVSMMQHPIYGLRVAGCS
jgi:hypothetical protein